MSSSGNDDKSRAPAVLMTLSVLCVALPAAFLRIASLPAEDHEVYVLLTSQEMHDRGDWIVPYFNDKPRLTKPPLNYWLTAAAAALTPGPFKVQPWHGRVPSAISGLVFVALTAALGLRLFGRTQAWFAAVIVASSSGFITYAHSARPEMTYAALCMAGIVCFERAYAAESDSRGRWLSAHAMWVCFGLATLAKGPHIPAMLLTGTVVFLIWRRAGWRQASGVLQPISGLAICLAIGVPWFVLVNRRLSEAGLSGISNTQLSGSLYRIDWLKALRPEYLMMYPRLFIPWSLPFICLPWLRRGGLDGSAKFLIALIACTLIPLSLAIHHRSFYALPVLPAGALLLADSAMRAAKAFAERESPPAWWRWLLGIHMAAGVAAIAYAASLTQPSTWIAPGMAIVAMSVAFAALKMTRGALPQEGRVFAPLSLCLAGGMISLLMSGSLWEREHFERPELARAAAQFLEPDTVLISFGFNDPVLLYYADHKIVHCSSREELVDILRSTPENRAVAVVSSEKRPSLSDPIAATLLVDAADDEDVVVSVTLVHGEPS